MTITPFDTGLLSPVRAGTPVEAAVSDHAYLQAMLDAEAALARAQARLGTVAPEAAIAIGAAARADRFDLRSLAVEARETANPVVGLVAALGRAVAETDPAAAEYVHRGSTSQDIFDTGAMLVSARALGIVRVDLARACRALTRLAAEHRDTPMAGRTLALHAVPVTFGLKAVGWRQLLLDAVHRLDVLLATGLPVSLGGAAGTLAGYLEYARIDGHEEAAAYPGALVAAFAEETGLAAPILPWHSLRTPVADLAAVLAFITGALGKIAVDIQSLTRTEVREVTEPGAVGRGSSSAMPHKRNPVLATLIRSAALQVPALAGALTQCMLAEDERSAGAWHAEWLLLRECLRLAGGAAHTAVELVEGLDVHPGRMRANLAVTGSLTASERIAAALAPRIGRTAAKLALSRASETADLSGRPLYQVLWEDPEFKAHFTADELTALCDPLTYTGAAGLLVDEALRSQHPAP
ncbi:3-carboxy-cis,cis-muconate cycloisomerase [Streptomyces sp. NPDC059443]|uniref:3-carboxy-cis,cis-muconate cycloisomerase n=1 Tax=unclassified Streptomyces TaxID=2593676 RepID=UPI0036912306